MPLRWRRLIALASLAIAGALANSLGPGNLIESPMSHVRLPPTAAVILLIWSLLSLAAKATMLRNTFRKWLTGSAVTAWLILIVRFWAFETMENSPGGTPLQESLFALWILAWPVVDVVDLFIPQNSWIRPEK